jgi:hypothetical protein
MAAKAAFVLAGCGFGKLPAVYNRFPPKFWREKRPPDSRQRSRSGFREPVSEKKSLSSSTSLAHLSWQFVSLNRHCTNYLGRSA